MKVLEMNGVSGNVDSLKEQVNIIDFSKLFFAVCIVALHTGLTTLSIFPEKMSWLITHMIIRLAVPFFFVTSGYFVGKKLHKASNDKLERMKVCKNYIKRNAPAFLLWSTIGLLFTIKELVDTKATGIVSKVVCQALFYPAGAMWFVLACMIAVLLITVLWEHKPLLIVVGG